MKKLIWISVLIVLIALGNLLLWSMPADTKENQILLSDSSITFNGTPLEDINTNSVYLERKTESHEDVPAELRSLTNRVVTITKGGVYRLTGTATDTQISVQAGNKDEVTLILDGVDISCRTAPAILVYSAKETNEVGKSGVTLTLNENSRNKITGSHTAKLHDDDVKYDAAISSAVSLTIDGNGSLEVIADNEGIEVKNKHLTINGGEIHIDSCDDPINASEDGVAHITINDGWIFGSSARGNEGDGIDSNGCITINGGTVISLGNPNSMDGGLDSDRGTVINGGTVIGAGNMYDPIETTGNQMFMYLQFADTVKDTLCIINAEGAPVFVYDIPYAYSYLSISSPALKEETYQVSLGGTIEGTQKDGLYTQITSVSKGTLLSHGGAMAQRPHFNMGEPPKEMKPSEGKVPLDGKEPPKGMKPPEMPEGMERPQGGRPHVMPNNIENATSDFTLSREQNGFNNITVKE